MSLTLCLCSTAPILQIYQFKVPHPKRQALPFSYEFPWICSTKSIYKTFGDRLPTISKAVARDSTFTENNTESFEWEDKEDVEDVGSPWEGAIIYKRNPSITHLEYCTTLERLGLGRLSSEISKSRASAMGLRVTKAVKDYPNGTPVHISIDVTRKKQKLRLDGIIRTVISLGCNRCGEPAAQSVFSTLSLLLTEQPIKEPDVIDIGIIPWEDKLKSSAGNSLEDDASIDWDDRLYFHPEEKEIDISKNIRDLVHLEITINAICHPRCKGICLKCGTNLNTSKCNCGQEEDVKEKTSGPLGNLRKQMERR